jgi:MATE family multidrug resistance protein
VQALMATSLYLGRHAVVGAFTGAAEVVAEAARIMPVVVVCICADGVNSLLSGVLRGCGRQAWGAGLNLVGYW